MAELAEVIAAGKVGVAGDAEQQVADRPLIVPAQRPGPFGRLAGDRAGQVLHQLPVGVVRTRVERAALGQGLATVAGRIGEAFVIGLVESHGAVQMQAFDLFRRPFRLDLQAARLQLADVLGDVVDVDRVEEIDLEVVVGIVVGVCVQAQVAIQKGRLDPAFEAFRLFRLERQFGRGGVGDGAVERAAGEAA